MVCQRSTTPWSRPSIFDQTKQFAQSILNKAQPTEKWLKEWNPALSGALSFAFIEEQNSASIALEQDWPNIVAYLALYNALRLTHHLQATHDDVEILFDWYGRNLLLGQTDIRGVQTAHACIGRVTSLAGYYHLFPNPEPDNLVALSVTRNTRTAKKKAVKALRDLTRDSQANLSPSSAAELPSPTDVGMLQTLEEVSTTQDQRRPYFDLLGFRTRIMSILSAAEAIYKRNNQYIGTLAADAPLNLARYAVLFLDTMRQDQRLGDRIGRHLAKHMEELIDEQG